MDEKQFKVAEAALEEGRIAEVNGRTASTREELEWIRQVERNAEQAQPEAQPVRVDVGPAPNVAEAEATRMEAEEARVRDLEQRLADTVNVNELVVVDTSGATPVAGDANPALTVEELADLPPVNPGQAEARERMERKTARSR